MRFLRFKTPIHRTTDLERGAVMVELSVVALLIAMILSATIDYNMYLKDQSALTEAVRAGARVAGYATGLVASSYPSRAPTLDSLTEAEVATINAIASHLQHAKIDFTQYTIQVTARRINLPRPPDPDKPAHFFHIGVQRNTASTFFFNAFPFRPCASTMVRIQVTEADPLNPKVTAAPPQGFC